MKRIPRIQALTPLVAFAVTMAVILFGAACNKAEESDLPADEFPSYIIIGRYTQASWCAGETCIETFKIDPNGLFEDSNDFLPSAGAFYNGQFDMELSTADYEQILQVLENKNYEPLFDLSDESIGNLFPDNFHFYFEYKSATIHRSWLIDASFDGSVPQAVQPLLNDMNLILQIAQF